MKTSFALGVTGFGLIAVTYGMARFSWGLMLPAIGQDISLTPRISGLIAAGSYAAYCFSVIVSSSLAGRFGARFPAAAAAICAAAGLLILSVSVSAGMLAVGLFIAGLSSGLASPALAAAVDRLVNRHQQSKINTTINAGTGAGIILSVPVLFFMPGGWRMACVVFAVLALLCIAPVIRFLPGSREGGDEEQGNWRQALGCGWIRRLIVIAFISGMASAAWWSFGPELLQNHSGVEKDMTSLLWLVSGGAGILAVLTGAVAVYTGLNAVYRASLLFMVAPLVMLAFSYGFSWWLIPAAALGGAGYVTLTGVLLVCGASAAPGAPAMGVGIIFLMVAVGQIAGSVIFGQIYGLWGAQVALIAFSVLPLALLGLTPDGKSPAGRPAANIAKF